MRSSTVSPLVVGIGAVFLLCATVLPGDLLTADSPSSAASGEWLAKYADLVKETEFRRRVNVLYPNPQSIFDGLQVGFVGVRHGNMTFRRRDIVAGELAHFSRVYDSRIQQGRDFGPGRRFSLAEELAVVDDGLIYTEGSGARYAFRLRRGDKQELLLSRQQVRIDADDSPAYSSIPTWSTYTAHPSIPYHAGTTI